MWRVSFYTFALIIEGIITYFVATVWRKSTSTAEGRPGPWRYTSVDSRTMYVDVVKTMITASGIAVALLASLSLNSQRQPCQQ